MRVVVGTIDNGFDRAVMRIPPFPFQAAREDDEGNPIIEDITNENKLHAFLDELYPEGFRIEGLTSLRDTVEDYR